MKDWKIAPPINLTIKAGINKDDTKSNYFTRQLDPKTVHELRYGKTKKI